MEKLTSDARAIARHVFAAHRGVRVGPEPVFVRCACCGLSPYGVSSRPKSELISDSFSDLDLLLDPTAPDVCAGCAALLGGRPGDDPPPFRTLSVAISVEAAGTSGITLHNGADLVHLLTHPPRELFAVSWSASRKKHAWLRPAEAGDDHVVQISAPIEVDGERIGALQLVLGAEDRDRPDLELVALVAAALGRVITDLRRAGWCLGRRSRGG